MTLELENLTRRVEEMALTAARRFEAQQRQAEEIRRSLREYAQAWQAVEAALERAGREADPKYFRAARPLDESEPLDAAVPPPLCPSRATIIAADGSQIMPDRHAAFLYYLVNVGAFVYYHGDDRTPDAFSLARLDYPTISEDDESEDEGFDGRPQQVTLARDLQEIGILRRKGEEYGHEARPLLGLLDQRLLYWPFGGEAALGERAAREWSQEMTLIRQAGMWLAGYIDRPGKRSVVTLLQALAAGDDFDWRSLGKRAAGPIVTDADLFGAFLRSGRRSRVFVDVSPANERFAELDPENQVCFFYMNPTKPADDEDADFSPVQIIEQSAIARVDIPLSVARHPEQVAVIHALVYEQCRLLGDYPYALARADELAVVGRQDQAELNVMIDLFMQRHGVPGGVTAKQASKELARGGRRRHMGF